MFRKVLYAVLMLISVFFYILFLGDLSLYTMVTVFAMPLIMAVILFVSKRLITCTVTSVTRAAVKRDECIFAVHITNRSIFPFPKARLTLAYTNTLSGAEDTLTIMIPIHPRNTQQIRFPLSSEYCGTIELRLLSLRITDYIRLFSAGVRCSSTARCLVFPMLFGNGAAPEIRVMSDSDSDIFSKTQSGDDPSEIFELKDYAPGDKISRIHWNLSSKQSSLITKHYSLGVSSPAAVIPDISFDGDIKVTDSALEIFFGISYRFIASGISFRIVLPDRQKPYRITGLDSLKQVYSRLLQSDKPGLCREQLAQAVMDNAKVYFITNRPQRDYAFFDDDMSCEQRYIFVSSDAFETSEKNAGNISIITVPSDDAVKALEENRL